MDNRAGRKENSAASRNEDVTAAFWRLRHARVVCAEAGKRKVMDRRRTTVVVIEQWRYASLGRLVGTNQQSRAQRKPRKARTKHEAVVAMTVRNTRIFRLILRSAVSVA
jgi:hypothetical protein